MWFRRLIALMVAVAAVAVASCGATGESVLPALRQQYPFAHSTVLYGYCPSAVWGYGAFVTVFAFEDTTDIRVIDLSTGFVLRQETLDTWEVFDQRIGRGTAFKVLASRPIGSLFGTVGVDSCPGMSFVPSRGNTGKEFIFYFCATSPGWGQPYMRCVNLFGWEDALVTVTDALTNTVYWEGQLAPGQCKRLTPPTSIYIVRSTGVLTVQLLGLCDASSFVLDRGQTGCGTEFMFHVLSPGSSYGRHSFYEVHAFQDADVKVYHADDPLNPVLFDEFHMLEGEHSVKVFDYFNNLFRLESTGKVTVMAGSFQTDVGGVHGPQSIGDMYTSVPSLDGEGRRFALGLHCANSAYRGGGFVVFATEDETEVLVGPNSYELNQDEWVWMSQPDTGVFYYDISSSKPVLVQTGSIGGDGDFDNIMTYLGGFGEPQVLCEPVEPPQMRTQGYWRRQCKDEPHEDICTHLDSVRSLADLFDDYDCDSVCDLLNVNPPEDDMCRKARRQYIALLLNLASGKLAACNCLADEREVGGVILEIDSILSGPLNHTTCVYVKTLADDLNNGRGIVPCDSLFAPVPSDEAVSLSCDAAPNPFMGRTTISYQVADHCRTEVRVYDRLGRLVRTLWEGESASGLHRVEWDGVDRLGGRVPTGVYFVRISTGKDERRRILVLVR